MIWAKWFNKKSKEKLLMKKVNKKFQRPKKSPIKIKTMVYYKMRQICYRESSSYLDLVVNRIILCLSFKITQKQHFMKICQNIY